ncbi:MAG: hypothetical protein ACI32H_02380 [Bacilli bacterium]
MEFEGFYIEKFIIPNLKVSIILLQEYEQLFNISYNDNGFIEITYHVPYIISKIQTIHLANNKLLRFILPRDVHIMSISKIAKEKTKLIIYKDGNFFVGYDEKQLPPVELIQGMPEIKVKSWVQPRYPLPEISSDFNFDLDLNL